MGYDFSGLEDPTTRQMFILNEKQDRIIELLEKLCELMSFQSSPNLTGYLQPSKPAPKADPPKKPTRY